MVRTILLVVALATIATIPERAFACSCVPPRLIRRVVPEHGSAGFPTDGVLRVFLEGFPESARPLLINEYRVRDAGGTSVTVDATVIGTRIDLRPRAPLAPNANYTIEQVFAFDAAGIRITDLQRLDAHGPLRGAWYPVATFTTGGGAAPRRSITARMMHAHLHFAYGGGDCGPATALATDVAFAPTVQSTDVVELRTRGGTLVASDLAMGTTSMYAGDMLCDPDPVSLPAGSSIEVHTVVLDATGREIGASAWTRVGGSGRRPSSTGRGGPLGAFAWSGVTVIPMPSALPVHGPASCANGLEVVSRHEVVSAGGPWAYADRTTLDGAGAAHWIAYGGEREGAHMQLFSIGETGAPLETRTALAGSPVAVGTTEHGALLAFESVGSSGRTTGHLAHLDTHGTPMWTVDLPGDGSDLRIARGAGRVLVAWSATQRDYTSMLAYSILDEQTGAPITSAAPTAYGLESNSEGPAAAWVDGRFMIVWQTGAGFSHGPLASAVVTATGLARPVELNNVATYSPPDLVGAGVRAGLATATSDGRVLFTVLDREGRVASGPFEVSGGIGGNDNRLPRVAWNGRMFAVAWETYPTPGAYVSIVDAAGAVSPAVRVDAGEPFAGTIGVSPTTNGWLAGYTTDRGRGRIAVLRCAVHAPLGAPQSIGPAR